MRKLFEFECPDAHTTEQLVYSEVRESACRVCGKPAMRVISMPRVSLDPISGDFPGETMKWAKRREQHMKLEQRAAEKHGPDAVWDLNR